MVFDVPCPFRPERQGGGIGNVAGRVMRSLVLPFCLLFLLSCVSCGNNEISIDAERASVYSPSGRVLRNLTLEDDSSEFLYRLSLKLGRTGLSSIDLNDIDEAYRISYGSRVMANKDFRLRPNASYSISNHSVPDAGIQTLRFTTNPSGGIDHMETGKGE